MARVQAGPAVTQLDFSGGIFRAGDAALMPASAFFDGQNMLLDKLGGVYGRGGSSYRSTAKYGEGLRKLWDGWLAAGHRTVVGSTTNYARLNDDGSMSTLAGTEAAKPGEPAAFKGVLYLPGGKTYDGSTVGTAAKVAPFYAVSGNRLVTAEGARVSFSKINEPATFEATDYWDLPGGVEILGLAGGRESVIVFTTNGIFVISGMTNNLTDEKGNIQQRLDHYAGSLVLWGANGVAAWEDSLIVPGTEAVWEIKRGVTSEQIASFKQLSQPIVDLYQEYVRDGYEPGQATVFRSHYVLPILGGGRVIDVLVCRLDAPLSEKEGGGCPWTRLSGYGAQLAAACTRVSASSSREPQLLGATYGTDSRVLNLAYLDPGAGATLDADGSTPTRSLTTRAYVTGNLIANTVTSLRLGYQLGNLEGQTPTIALSINSETPPAGAAIWDRVSWGAFTWATTGANESETVAGAAPPQVAAAKTYRWRFARRRRRVQFTLSVNEPTVSLAIKSIELFIRQAGLT